MASDPYGAGQNVLNYLRSPPATISALGQPVDPVGTTSTVGDFFRGLFGAARNAPPPAIHPAIVAAMAQPTTGVPVTALTDKSMAQYGALSPAARAVLGNVDVNGVVKNAPVPTDQTATTLQGVPTMMQLMAGYAAGHGGNISLRAIDALSGAAAKGAAAGSATRKAPGIADIAGAQALQLSNQYFNAQRDSAAKAGNSKGYDDATQRHLEFLKELSRGKAYDPLSGDAYSPQPQ